jgi:branched-chain amino acid transport system ATP-binding protein
MALLEVDRVSKAFRGLRAVEQASLDVPEGAIVALIGPNGAGKTTLFNVIAGVYTPDAGEVRLAGESIGGLRPDQVCARGIGRTFQIVKPFPELSVLDNVIVGALQRERRVASARAFAITILERLGLADRQERLAASLTLSDRKRLEVARALATRPKLLLLDEVMAGLLPTETDLMVGVFKDLNARYGTTILLIEHVMRAVMALAQHVVVLNHGEVIARGAPAEVVRVAALVDL